MGSTSAVACLPPMSADSPLSIRDLAKRYGSVTAVDGIDFDVRRGECFGLLGPNGAGKTTTLSMICTLVRPDSGTITVNGLSVADDPEEVRRTLGLVPQDVSLYANLTGRENLGFFGSLFGLKRRRLEDRIRETLALAGLEDRADDRAATYSGGMKRRLNLAVGLIHEPPLLLLDEPTVGVDPQSRNHLFEMVTTLKERGVTLVYTTHYMEEAERLCDRIAIMDHGKLVALGTRDELVRRIGGGEEIDLTFSDGGPDEQQLGVALEGFAFRARPGGVTIPVKSADALNEVLARCARARIGLDGVTMRRPNLERVFLALTGRELRD